MDPSFQQKYLDRQAKACFWFTGRRDLLRRLLAREGRGEGRLLLVGCGDGADLASVAPAGRAFGLEYSDYYIRVAVPEARPSMVRADLQALPFGDGAFHTIVCFDILEHVDRDAEAARRCFRALVPDGLFLVTVPAFPGLWSVHDEINHHRRRYRRRDLVALLTEAGFRIEHLTYWNFLLFPVVAATRWWKRTSRSRRDDMVGLPGPVNRFLAGCLTWENRRIARGGRFPYGVSLVAVARRPGSET